MKGLIFTLLITALIIESCNNPKAENSNLAELPDISTEISETGIEENLKTQLTIYFNAILNGEPSKAMDYCLPEMFAYFQEGYPELSRTEIENQLIKDVSIKFKEEQERRGFKFQFEINDLQKKYAWGNNVVYEVTTYIHVTEKLRKVSEGDKILALSDDNGFSWKFIQKDDEVIRPILLMKYTEEIVNNII